jgi:MFS family permease
MMSSVNFGAGRVLRERRFRFMIAVQFGNAVGVWAHVVAGQWVLVERGTAPSVVALVPALISLPFLILAIPLGAIVSRTRREPLMALSMAAACVGSAAIVAAAGTHHAGTWPILISTAIIGVGLVCVGTAWQSLLPETVERSLISEAAVFDGATFNAARALGPVMAGVLLGLAGPVWAFGANTVIFGVCAVLMYSGGRKWPSRVGAPEPLLRSVRQGLRFVRFSPWTRRLLTRLGFFSIPTSALWALLPVVAHERLGVEAAGLGFLTGMLGCGAVLGVLFIAPLRASMPVNVFAALGTMLYAVALAVLATSNFLPLTALFMLAAGVAWVSVQSTWMMLANEALPRWVHARIIAILLFVFQVAQAIGAMMWGLVADQIGARGAVYAASVALALTVLGFKYRGLGRSDTIIPEPYDGNATPLTHAVRGRICVEFAYRVQPAHMDDFLAAMRDLRTSRMRLGADGWVLLLDPADASRCVERIRFDDADDFLAQEGERLTVPEQHVRDQVARFARLEGEPRVMQVAEVRASGRFQAN